MLLAVAAVAVVSCQTRAAETTVSTSENSATLPDGVPLGSPVGQVFKLAQAGVDPGVIQTYISNCPSAFNLQADDIIALTDAGVTAEMLNAMYAHDKTLPATAVATAAPDAPVPSAEQAGSPPPAPAAGTDTAPVPAVAPADLSQGEIDQTLAPYGSWVQVAGYGRCWRPSVVVYDATWQPYCDRGRWVYTDYGWYWNSDYAWGVTFHYGRWFNSPQYGWCWWPDTVWAPSWVTWRSSTEYCGWAPLPPFSVYRPGIGFVYRGNHVAVGFDFGLAANCFTFVSVGHFCEPHPRYYCVPRPQVAHVYGQTAIINNYGHHNRTIVNGGVSVTFIGNATHHPIQPVPVGSLLNPSRRGWHGQSHAAPGHRYGASTSDGSSGRQYSGAGYHYDAAPQNNDSRWANENRQPPFGGAAQTANRHAGTMAAGHPQTSPGPGNQRGSRVADRNFNLPVPPSPGPAWSANHNPSPATAPVRNQPRNNASWLANGNGARPNVRSEVPFVASQQPRLTSPRNTIAAPTVAVARPQYNQPRQNFVQSAPHNIMPAAPAQPSRAQIGNGPAPGWMARNH